MISKVSLFLIVTAFSTLTIAAPLIQVSSGLDQTIDEVVDRVEPGTVVILGESHASAGANNLDQINQVEFIKALTEKYDNVHVGMEFINYTVQDSVDQYLRGELTDDEFKAAVGWGGNPFDEYQKQLLLPLEVMGWTHALNAPRTLTRAIAKKGLEDLTAEELSLMPPQFSLGSDIYKKRFYEIMGVTHDDGNAVYKNMFAAQCTWDDTMAWKALEKFEANPQQVMVVIVGNFHARYGGGLEDRLRARGHNKIMTIVQVDSNQLSDQEKLDLIVPHKDYGVIADYIW